MEPVFVRPPGPIKVWNAVESVKKDGSGEKIIFSIQEIPEDRYEDVVEHMVKNFIPDEPVSASVNAKDDPLFVEDFRTTWGEMLKQGLSVAAFVDDPNGGKAIIAGVNILGVDFKEHVATLDDFKEIAGKGIKVVEINVQLSSPKSRNVFGVILGLSKEADVYEKYDVDRYMYALGLSVHPSYRGQSLGGHILNARINIGREYKIPVTSTAFTSPISQKLAERSGFEVLLEKDYDKIHNAEGKLAFPNIKVKTFKIMARLLY